MPAARMSAATTTMTMGTVADRRGCEAGTLERGGEGRGTLERGADCGTLPRGAQ